jgi:1,4-alpha-glucan branching enzyme
MGGIFWELTNKRADEKVVSYVESHDQALVGGKTFFFQLADAAIYWGMAKDQHGLEVERAIALHKMARLATCALNGGAYLDFMGNEFGHPEWIDFPREENGWSYHHARRQWSLRDDPNLRFKALGDFDQVMVNAIAANAAARGKAAMKLAANEPDKVLAFVRGDLLFVFNFNPTKSFEGYGIMVPPGTKWAHFFDTDEERFGGQGKIASGQEYDPVVVEDRGELVQQIKMYLPARTATVLRRRP